ncbi:hypothetical protein FDZ71_11090, partial [bacterium]
MIKILIQIFLFYILYRIIKEMLFGDEKPKKKIFREKEPEAEAFTPKEPPRAREELVQDPECGVYVPKNSSISSGGDYFCSPECLEA